MGKNVFDLNPISSIYIQLGTMVIQEIIKLFIMINSAALQ